MSAHEELEGGNVIERILVITLGVALVYTGVRAREELQVAEGQAEAWRRLYLAADSDAKYVNCLELDDEHAICEKVITHGKDR